VSNDLHLVKWARDAGLAQSCFKRHRIYDYRPGCVRYTFGHYPTRNPYYPTSADWEQLDRFCENGVEMIIVFEEWRLFREAAHRTDQRKGVPAFHRRMSSQGFEGIALCFSGVYGYPQSPLSARVE